MNQHTNNTRIYPRTLQQAFGPYTDNVLHPMPEKRRPAPQPVPATSACLLRRILVAITGH